MTDSTPKNVIQLVRVSTKAQAAEDRAGIAAQQDACERIAKSYGLNIASRIELVDVSGAAIMTTPEMQQLIRALYSRTFHGVIVKEFSRALRPENYDFYLFQVMTETRSTLYTANGPMEPWTSQGRMMVAFNGVIAANELETIRARMQGGKEAKRRQGKHPGNEQSLPYGVGYSEDRGWYYEAEAQNVREMFRLYLSGVPLVEICGKLGLKRHLVTYALSNRIYTGVRVYDHKSDPSVRRFTADGRQKNSPRIRRPPEEIIEKRVISPPLISDAEFERVQDMMASRARRHVRSAPRMQFVYGGYLTCSICGSMVHVAHQREGYYVCGAK
nr:recombinase family protein [Terriglobales bacterium]